MKYKESTFLENVMWKDSICLQMLIVLALRLLFSVESNHIFKTMKFWMRQKLEESAIKSFADMIPLLIFLKDSYLFFFKQNDWTLRFKQNDHQILGSNWMNWSNLGNVCVLYERNSHSVQLLQLLEVLRYFFQKPLHPPRVGLIQPSITMKEKRYFYANGYYLPKIFQETSFGILFLSFAQY